MLAIAVVSVAAIIIAGLLTPPSPEDRLRAMRGALTELRQAADSCRTALEREEARLRAEDERLDSLRSLIAYYEALDRRGVPADSYEAYITAFNAYNDAIAPRTFAGDTLQAHWRECRALAERHNLTADSARAIATELGLIRDSSAVEAVR